MVTGNTSGFALFAAVFGAGIGVGIVVGHQTAVHAQASNHLYDIRTYTAGEGAGFLADPAFRAAAQDPMRAAGPS